MSRIRASATAVLLLASCALFSGVPAVAEEGVIDWQKGPVTVRLGDDLARLNVGRGYLFAGEEDTRLLMELMGNPTTDTEIGLVTPMDETKEWFIVFEHESIGFVRDDDGSEIDADALLESISEATEQSNKERKRMGAEALHVVGWFEKPHYDPVSHNLVWALEAEDDSGNRVVNYNVRLLGRRGYTSVTLVTEPSALAAEKPEVETLLAGFKYEPGNRYADFVKGDRVAEIGLAALVAGGAGAAAVKLGLFAKLAKFLGKAWKLVVVAIVALGGFLKRLFGGGRRGPSVAPH